MADINTPRKSGKQRYKLVILSALFCVFQIVSAVRVLQIPGELIPKLNLLRPLEFIASVLWALAFLFASLVVVQNKGYGLRYMLGVFAGFAMYSMARLALFAQTDYDRRRLPFLLALGFLLLILFFLIHFLRVRRQTREKIQYGSKPQN